MPGSSSGPDPDPVIPTAADLARPRPTVYLAGADVGQGAHTAFVQMAAEATGLDPDRVTGHFSDSATSGDSGSASASRLTFMTGNAILGSGRGGRQGLAGGSPRPAEGAFRYVPPPTEAARPRRPTDRAQLRLRLCGRGGRPVVSTSPPG